jgi:hypothetical protein
VGPQDPEGPVVRGGPLVVPEGTMDR